MSPAAASLNSAQIKRCGVGFPRTRQRKLALAGESAYTQPVWNRSRWGLYMSDANNPILKALVPEQHSLARQLNDVLKSHPLYAKLFSLNQVVVDYGGQAVWVGSPTAVPAEPRRGQPDQIEVKVPRVSPPLQMGTTVPREFSYGQKTKAVEDVATAYLTERGFRATSAQILPAVLAAGIPMSGKSQRRTLASFLTTSARFNNVHPYGYGLVEWGEGNGPKASADGIVPLLSDEGSGLETAPKENGPPLGGPDTGGNAA